MKRMTKRKRSRRRTTTTLSTERSSHPPKVHQSELSPLKHQSAKSICTKSLEMTGDLHSDHNQVIVVLSRKISNHIGTIGTTSQTKALVTGINLNHPAHLGKDPRRKHTDATCGSKENASTETTAGISMTKMLQSTLKHTRIVTADHCICQAAFTNTLPRLYQLHNLTNMHRAKL